MGVVESLAGTLEHRKEIEPCSFTDLWAVLAAGEEAQATITEICRDNAVGKLIVTVRFIDGSEYEVSISNRRRWL